jgi:hypothetical protein
MADKKPIELEEGWASMQVRAGSCAGRAIPPCCALLLTPRRPTVLQRGIDKLIRLLEGETESQFNAEQYMMLYT